MEMETVKKLLDALQEAQLMMMIASSMLNGAALDIYKAIRTSGISADEIMLFEEGLNEMTEVIKGKIPDVLKVSAK